MKLLILIPGQNAVWRYDQIAAVELNDTDLKIIPVRGFTAEEIWEYGYDNEDEAKEAFAQVLKDWKQAITPDVPPQIPR